MSGRFEWSEVTTEYRDVLSSPRGEVLLEREDIAFNAGSNAVSMVFQGMRLDPPVSRVLGRRAR